jgi:hypothetical protein
VFTPIFSRWEIWSVFLDCGGVIQIHDSVGFGFPPTTMQSCVTTSPSLNGLFPPCILDEIRTGLWPWHTLHIHGHLWHRYVVTVNHITFLIADRDRERNTRRGELDTTCVKVCHLLAPGQWFFSGYFCFLHKSMTATI